MEADAIVGKNHKGTLVTINDRATEMLKMKRTSTREAGKVNETINELLEDWLTYIRTITSDNEKEFASHKEVARINQVGLYFANPYCS